MAKSSTSAAEERVPEVSEITTSRCITVTESTATLSLEVTDYPKLKGMGVGQFIKSRVFKVGGNDWEMRFYPDGFNNECDDNASVIVYYLNARKEELVSTRWALSMLEKKSQVDVVSPLVGKCVFTRRKLSNWGYTEFVKKAKLDSLSELGDGCFTVLCVFTVIIYESPAMELPRDLEGMRRDGRETDVTFHVDGQEFPAHRSLLAARSAVLEAQLFGPMADKDMQCVKVVDMEPAIFDMILHYIYTDLMPICDDEEGYSTAVMQHLLVAADRYGLDRLKSMCEEELCERIDAETITTTSALADQHHCERLKDACQKFELSELTKVLSVTTATD
ncbi:hypothetical protein ACQJBY_017982 [Aegilops geniculata]